MPLRPLSYHSQLSDGVYEVSVFYSTIGRTNEEPFEWTFEVRG